MADPELQTRVKIISQKVAAQENLQECDINISAGSDKGDGFVGLLSSVTISSTSIHETAPLHLMIKTAHVNVDIREVSPIRRIFLREIAFYNEIYPEFVHFQRERFSGERRQILTSIPRCYLTDSSDLNETLVLENLKVCGFHHWDKKVPMNEAHLTMVMEEYGKFHAISFAMKLQTPDVYKKITEQFKDDLAAKFLEMSMPLFNRLIDYVKLMFKSEDEKDILERIKGYQNNLQEFFDENIKDRNECRLDNAVIVHGDCWCNNMMFKYKIPKDNSKPSEMRLLDFQIVGENSPVFDLSHFFYTAASGSDIADYKRYLQAYHGSFVGAVTQLLGANVELTVTFDALLDHWKKYSRYGLTMASLAIKVMLAKNPYAVASKSVQVEYEKRMKQLVLHFYENGFI